LSIELAKSSGMGFGTTEDLARLTCSRDSIDGGDADRGDEGRGRCGDEAFSVTAAPRAQPCEGAGAVRGDDAVIEISLEILRELERVRVTGARLASHGARDDRDELVGRSRRDLSQRARRTFSNPSEDHGGSGERVRPAVRRVAREELVEHRAESIDVRARIDVLDASLRLL